MMCAWLRDTRWCICFCHTTFNKDWFSLHHQRAQQRMANEWSDWTNTYGTEIRKQFDKWAKRRRKNKYGGRTGNCDTTATAYEEIKARISRTQSHANEWCATCVRVCETTYAPLKRWIIIHIIVHRHEENEISNRMVATENGQVR